MWLATCTALVIMIGSWSAAVAQEVRNARVTPPAAPGQELGSPQLQAAEQRLQEALHQLEQSARNGSGQHVERARQNVQQALNEVRQALGGQPQ